MSELDELKIVAGDSSEAADCKNLLESIKASSSFAEVEVIAAMHGPRVEQEDNSVHHMTM